MFNYEAIQTLLQKVLDEDIEAINLRKSEDGEWLSLYDVFRQTGVVNNTQAFQSFENKFPALTENFEKVKFPGRGKHKSWAFHKLHLPSLVGIFGVLAQKFPSPEVAEPQPKTPSPVVQFTFSGMFSPKDFDLPPVPKPPSDPVPEDSDKKLKNKKTVAFKEISTSWIKMYKSIRKEIPTGGNGPYGWNLEDKLLSLEPGEALVLREMERRSCLGQSPKQIANFLNREEIHNRENQPWQEKEIKAIVDNSPRIWLRWAKQQKPLAKD